MHALIVSNGFPPARELLEIEIQKADLVIGADGGGNRILDHGFIPHAVIGDLDSFEKPEDPGFEVIHKPDQETNDLEKALSHILQQEARTCTVLGAFGKRMDHALKNLSVLKKFNDTFEELVYKDERFDAFLISDSFKAERPVGTIISLFPLSGEVRGVSTSGLKYSLNKEVLKNGERDGTSNETISEEFHIETEAGDLVIFVERNEE